MSYIYKKRFTYRVSKDKKGHIMLGKYIHVIYQSSMVLDKKMCILNHQILKKSFTTVRMSESEYIIA